MPLNQEQLNRFREQKERLGSMLSESSDVISELKMTSASENLCKLSEKVNNDTFKIQVIGTFKNGKSTFINSLLGEPVLPAYALPTTAVINEVKYGETKEAFIYFRNPLPDKLPESISPKAKKHMEAHGMKNVPPLKCSYEEIEDYVCIPMGSDPTEMLLESPYEKVELFWPLDLLKEGVEIIDSPGLNEAETRTRVTMDYLSKADAILFVLNAIQLCSMDEMNFIENNLKAYGFTDPFFIVNRYDLIPENQKEGIKRFAEMKLAEYSTNQIFYVSAQQALDGAMENNDQLYQKSNMGEFTRILSDFLTKDKGKIKLSQPARELKRILNDEALYKVIPGQRTMLDSSLDDVKERYEKSKPQLENLRAKKEQLINKLQLRIAQSEHEFRRAYNQNILNLTNLVTGWVNDFEPKTGIMPPTRTKVERLIKEISDHLSTKIEANQNEWKSTVLIPLVNERANQIFESVETDVSKLNEQIILTHQYISGNTSFNTSNGVSPIERVVGAIGGFLLGGAGAAYTGSITGLSSGLAKTIALNIGGAILLNVIGCVNPVTLIALLIGTIVGGNFFGGIEVKKKVKSLVATQIINNLSTGSHQNGNEIAKQICDELSKITNKLGDSLDDEIENVEQQVNSIIKEMEKGKANIDARKKVLNSCETKIKSISSDLDAFTFELIEQM